MGLGGRASYPEWVQLKAEGSQPAPLNTSTGWLGGGGSFVLGSGQRSALLCTGRQAPGFGVASVPLAGDHSFCSTSHHCCFLHEGTWFFSQGCDDTCCPFVVEPEPYLLPGPASEGLCTGRCARAVPPDEISALDGEAFVVHAPEVTGKFFGPSAFLLEMAIWMLVLPYG